MDETSQMQKDKMLHTVISWQNPANRTGRLRVCTAVNVFILTAMVLLYAQTLAKHIITY